MTGLQAFSSFNPDSSAKGVFHHCLILLLFVSSPLFNPESLAAQSSVGVAAASLNRIPTSITAAQRSTEAKLQKMASTFSIRHDETLEASNVFELLSMPVFIDTNLEGVFDSESDLTLTAGVSMAKCLQMAFRENDSVYMVQHDGSILIISIDDEMEPDYSQTVIYDVTSLAGSVTQAQRLGHWMTQTISSDSWEFNGGGNGSMAFYSHNGRILMSVSQSYSIHLQLRRHLSSTSRLAGSTIVVPSPAPVVRLPAGSHRSNQASANVKLASSVVQVPTQHTKSNRRKRRGFSRPDSGSSSGFGGGGMGGGVF